ncbi:hypothetical protein BY458DRAFT_537726 [Sporodiniella umbellata]|nr:hypothetical protein BY458DRAFT_537726 [Sporodiniella umbellata]
MVRSKKQGTPEVERLVSKFFKEDGHQVQKQKMNWKQVTIPESIKTSPLLAKLRQLSLQTEDTKEEEANFKIDLAEKYDNVLSISVFFFLILVYSEKIETVRKENMFGEEVTESEMDIIQQRVALQQRQFQEFEKREHKRKSIKIKSVYDYLSSEEMSEMLIDCKHDEEEVIVRLTQPTYLLDIRRTIATKHAPEVEVSHNAMSEEQMTAYKQLLKKRSETLKKTTNDSAKKQYRMCGRLSLDEAIRQAKDNKDLDKAFEGWSQARIRAWSMRNENPNSYYYRFNAPGEEQRKGQWDADERVLFFKRLDEVGANGQWGIFSMTIPGRVGYQCSNFYRLLVETAEINDPNYVLDERGKAHYLFDKKTADGNVEKTFRTHNKHGGGRVITASPSVVSLSSTTSTSAAAPTRKRARAAPVVVDKKKRKRKTRGWNSDDDDEDDFEDYNDDSGTFTMSMRTTRRARHQEPIQEVVEEYMEDDEQDENIDNPLPGFLDPITLEEVVKPAISRYGHVMGYDSWVRCLTNWEGKKNICPLTKKTLTKRDLVILTHENIEEYRDKIIQ